LHSTGIEPSNLPLDINSRPKETKETEVGRQDAGHEAYLAAGLAVCDSRYAVTGSSHL
jgi:hypothetical protein